MHRSTIRNLWIRKRRLDHRNILANKISLLALVIGSFVFLIWRMGGALSIYQSPIATNEHGDLVDVEVSSIALLFLVRGEIPLHKIWERWLLGVAGWIPSGAPLARVCRSNNQSIYRLYIHATPDFKGYNESVYSCIWNMGLLPAHERVETQWGDYSLVKATMILLQAAYRHASNDYFILLSESDIPLWDPFTLYIHALAEKRSFVNACPGNGTMKGRWQPEMQTETFTVQHWRKSSQFFGLHRRHAEIILDDTLAKPQFERWCGLECYPDEHIIPTILAVHGLDNQTFCESMGVAHTVWPTNRSPHPTTFLPDSITVENFISWREKPIHQTSQYQKDAATRFEPCSDRNNPKPTGPTVPGDWVPMDGILSLTMRKFDPSTVDALLEMFSDCSNGLYMLGAASCTGQGLHWIPRS